MGVFLGAHNKGYNMAKMREYTFRSESGQEEKTTEAAEETSDSKESQQPIEEIAKFSKEVKEVMDAVNEVDASSNK